VKNYELPLMVFILSLHEESEKGGRGEPNRR
jgi:hypothetical protein